MIEMVAQPLHCVDNGELGSVVETEKEKSPKGKVEPVVSSQRRTSARIQATRQRAEKEELVRKRVELLDENEEEGSNKRTSVYSRRRVNVENVSDVVEERKESEDFVPSEVVKPAGEVVKANFGGQNGVVCGGGGASEKSVFARVKETLRLFNKHYLHFVQEEEKRCRKKRVDKKSSRSSKSKKGNAIKADAKKKAKRPDLKAITQMIDSNAVMYPEKRIGDLPGINVGHQFYSRAEMVAVGFHSHWLNGIDYMGMSYRKEYGNYTLPLAVAIVLSGMYEDDLDNADDVIYTGQGGHDLTGNKRQVRDQVMERGNLALKVQFVYGRVPQSISEIRGLVCEDISAGQEDVPIPATNLVDDPPVPPTGFTYCKALQIAKNVKIPTNASACNCKEACVDPQTCACAKLNGFDFPYVRMSRQVGRLIEAKAIVFECGPNCGCGSNCVNRTSQGGLKFRFEVFRSPKKGWAVRSWDFIPSGAPICEYVGVLKRTEDLDSISENNYIFEIDCLQTMRGIDGRERRLGEVSVPTINNTEGSEDQKLESVPEFCIDAGSTGNIARFINHSCEPNLFVQCVLSAHHDLKLARVMLFAADNIPPLQVIKSEEF
uniref:SET domain-containing protein n=1 Tax=Manihot esculenta TaxID=3983 RepID=A0A2C9W0Z9_MANES